MLRALAVFLGVLAGAMLVLLAAVGQLGKIDRQTLVVVVVVSVVAAGAAAARARG